MAARKGGRPYVWGHSKGEEVRIALTALLATITTLSFAAVPLTKGVTVKFLDAEAGGEFLAQPDDFTRSLSPFDRSVRLKVAREVTQKEFLAYVSKHGLDWTDKEEQWMTQRVKEVRMLLNGYRLPLPKTILLIKTTGKEDAGAAYTRRNAIVFSAHRLKRNGAAMRKLFLHELFHVLSRNAPKLATKMYQIIGYEPSPELIFPEELAPRKLTNPDAPFSRHAIKFEHEGDAVKAIPILYSRVTKYDEKKGGTLFQYLVFRLLVLNEDNPAGAARDAEGKLILIRPDDAKGFHEKIGRNTGYIIHPEETMADNFVYLITAKKDLPNPEIIQRLGALLRPDRD